jgi:DNA-binding CsgD family transcriptional regulator
MKKFLAVLPVLFLLILNFTGCNVVGEKNGSPAFIYMAAAALSLALLVGCIYCVRTRRLWFITLFSSVLGVNIGYTLLSVSTSLEMALWANRLSYLGSVFLPLSMLMILLMVTNTAYKKWLPKVLCSVSALVFLIAASPGILPIYYKEVSFAVVNGVATLVKVYGPLHPLYFVYLLGYFSAMISVIVHAQARKTMDSSAHAIVLAIAVFVNIGVWLIEQLVHFDFEFLSISYIISELFLLGVHLVMTENQRLREIVRQVESAQTDSPSPTPDAMLENPVGCEPIDAARIELFASGLRQLTIAERSLYNAYIARATTKEIMASMHIKESTLKYHSRNLYGKLGVSTRKELLELHKYIRSVKNKLEEPDTSAK